MSYVEFIVFVARVSYESFRGSQGEGDGLHLKIEKCLKSMLATVELEPTFTFG